MKQMMLPLERLKRVNHNRRGFKRQIFSKALSNEFVVQQNMRARAECLVKELRENPGSYPFDEIVYTDNRNSQPVGHQPVTFFREVLALCDHPDLLDRSETRHLFSADSIERASHIIQQTPGKTTGVYCQYVEGLQKTIASGIAARDGFPVNPDDIFLTEGAAPAIDMMIKFLIRSDKDGILCPIPQYILYSHQIAVHGGSLVSYYLNEASGWRVEVSELEKQLEASLSRGITVRALVVINPGNPTGQVLRDDNQQEIVDFCKRRKLILLADEVHQDNIYVPEKKFHSFKKIVRSMGYVEDEFLLVSFQSVSKGYYSQYGKTGGYMEIIGFSCGERKGIFKYSMMTARNFGQIFTSLVMNPPKVGDVSYESYMAEKDALVSSLARRAKRLEDVLNSLEFVTCNKVEGGMYLFPRLHLPQKAIQVAEAEKESPDAFYADRLREATGICVIPGTGFGQVVDTWHFRLIIPLEDNKVPTIVNRLTAFHHKFVADFCY